jgi:co-chaperonin GroES (HSP10)
MQAATAEAVAKKYRIIPSEGWVVIRKLIRGEEVTEGGVILPETKDDRSQRGEVLELGSCARRIPLTGVEVPWDIAVGDMVIFTNYPMDIPDVEELVGEKNLVMVRAEEIFGRAKEV